jgi:hypothetical protein
MTRGKEAFPSEMIFMQGQNESKKYKENMLEPSREIIVFNFK